VDELVQGLLAAGYSVQLSHDAAETSASDHGWVRVSSADGTDLAAAKDVQHNRNFAQRAQTLRAMVALVIAAAAGDDINDETAETADA
jgi:hypothetical protein